MVTIEVLFKLLVIYVVIVGLNLRKNLVKCYIWSIALCGAEIWTLQKLDHKHLSTF
jgi:hypothetical protein